MPASTDARPVPFRHSDRAFRQERYATYAHMRRYQPVHYDAELDTWSVFRAHDVATVLRHPTARVSMPPAVAELFEPWTPEPLQRFQRHMLLFVDDPDHARIRGILQKAFGPRAVEQLRDGFHTRAVTFLESLEPGQVVDIVNEFAVPLFMETICELLGIPADEHESFRQWTHAIDRMIDIPIILDEVAAAAEAAQAMTDHLGAAVRRRSPHRPGDDLLGALIAAEVDGERLTHDELLATAALLLIAGHDTTVSLVSNAVHSLLSHPEQLALLRSDRSLAQSAIEEVLRFQSPLQVATGGGRYLTEPLELGGHRIEPGSKVIVFLGSANRDEALVDEPDRFDIRRPPSRHLAFGKGAHFCLGATLARMEGAVVLSELLDRFPAMEFATDPAELAWLDILHLRQLEALPVRLG